MLKGTEGYKNNDSYTGSLGKVDKKRSQFANIFYHDQKQVLNQTLGNFNNYSLLSQEREKMNLSSITPVDLQNYLNNNSSLGGAGSGADIGKAYISKSELMKMLNKNPQHHNILKNNPKLLSLLMT